MSRKRWVVRSFDKEKATTLAEELNISPYAALIASTRGIESVTEARDFFGMSCDAADPMDFPDMEKAVDCIKKAIDNFERIAVFGDYDADGVTATALLYSYLEMQGADVVYCVPDRHTEGYGLSFAAADKLCKMGAKLIITVDNGISSIEESKYIRELEADLIVTDHHLPSAELPTALAVVDPHREDCKLRFKDYAGVGVAYKLICAIEGGENDITNSVLDLVALGTVADVMPLKGENRNIIRRGLEVLEASERPGVQALRDVAGYSDKELNSGAIAFTMVPRINAAGRMGSAMRAVRLLLSDDYEEAAALAAEINEENISRQQIESDILECALEQIKANKQWEYDPVLVVDGEDWHDGVIGIVASRLTDKFGKPSIVITRRGDTAKGSGRSVEGFDLYNALRACSDTLTQFGGHKLAAGIGLESSSIDNFRKAFNAYAVKTKYPIPVQYIDFKIKPAYINDEMLNVIDMLEPFGTGNPQPIFGLYKMTLARIQAVGGGKHLKLTFTRDESSIVAMKFRTTPLDFPFCVGDLVDLAVTFEANEFLGQRRLSINIKNIKFHSSDDDLLFEQQEIYTNLMRGESVADAAKILPDRNDTVQVYKFLRSAGRWRYGIETLCVRLNRPMEAYAKTAVSVEALTELGVLVRDNDGSITLPEESVKANLDDAPILQRIKNML
ncbi:MAG: single-stranded-DNA-specific exonuclease RecJ [Clostridia bacterium]|nr:single-stranded-DNA-specific exonuclease RecJ [Clostridia bacterium]